MKATIIGLLYVTAGSLMSCGQATPASTAGISNEINPKAKGQNSCLLAYAEKYSDLLTKEMAAEAMGMPADQAIMGISKLGLASNEYDYVQYEWENGREKLVKQINRKVKEKDYVKLTGIAATSLDNFKMTYRAVSDEDIGMLDEKIERSVRAEAPTAASKNAQKKLDDLGISREQQEQMMKDFSGMAKKVTHAYVTVENIGDAAVWNGIENTFYVFTNGAKFQVVVEVGEDPDQNKAIALALARTILARCK